MPQVDTKERDGILIVHPVKADTKVCAGEIGCLDADGYLVPASVATGLKAVGRIEETVKKRASEIEVPSSGGVRVHNDAETWQAVTPDLQAANGAENARTVRNHILGGSTLPEHWYGGGGDVNRSTAGEMGEPTFKTFKFRQTEWKHILETVCFYAIYSRLEKTGNIPEDLRNYRPVAQFPELTHRDTSVYAAALQ